MIGSNMSFFYKNDSFGDCVDDCPVLKNQEQVMINGLEATRYGNGSYAGGTGGNIPESFIGYEIKHPDKDMYFRAYLWELPQNRLNEYSADRDTEPIPRAKQDEFDKIIQTFEFITENNSNNGDGQNAIQEWKTFRNERLGVEFDYPAKWGSFGQVEFEPQDVAGLGFYATAIPFADIGGMNIQEFSKYNNPARSGPDYEYTYLHTIAGTNANPLPCELEENGFKQENENVTTHCIKDSSNNLTVEVVEMTGTKNLRQMPDNYGFTFKTKNNTYPGLAINISDADISIEDVIRMAESVKVFETRSSNENPNSSAQELKKEVLIFSGVRSDMGDGNEYLDFKSCNMQTSSCDHYLLPASSNMPEAKHLVAGNLKDAEVAVSGEYTSRGVATGSRFYNLENPKIGMIAEYKQERSDINPNATYFDFSFCIMEQSFCNHYLLNPAYSSSVIQNTQLNEGEKYILYGDFGDASTATGGRFFELGRESEIQKL